MRRLAQRRLVEVWANGVKFVFAPPPMACEAQVLAAIPDPAPPPLVVGGKQMFVRDARGALELVAGKAVPICDEHSGEHAQALRRAVVLRAMLWIAHSLEAAGDHNAHLRADGQAHIFGPTSYSRAFAEHVEQELHECCGLGEGDVVKTLLRGYQQAIGTVVEDVERAEKNSPVTAPASAPSSPASG